MVRKSARRQAREELAWEKRRRKVGAHKAEIRSRRIARKGFWHHVQEATLGRLFPD